MEGQEGKSDTGVVAKGWKKKRKMVITFSRDTFLLETLLSGLSDFCGPILRVREGCVDSRIHSNLCLLCSPKNDWKKY